MTTATSLPRVPEGLRDLMKVYTKEVLREKPADLYGFSANFFNVIVGEKSQKAVRKYEPVQTYETIMKNRIRQQVPLSLVFNIIPEKLTDLIKQFIKAVLREKPENIYIFAQEYFQRMSNEKSGRIEYTKYSTYEKSLKDKENVTPGSKVTCECGRILSGKTKDVENRYTDTKLAEADQRTFSSRITYLQSVVIIQRRIRQFLKERKIGRDKDNCNSLEYVTAILLIQRQVRRLLAKKRVEELKNARDVRKPNAKFNTGDYMKAVVVIQRHYRIYLRKKQEQNRLKNGPVSLVTAAIIIQRAFRRMVALQRAKRNTSSATDQAEELNDNASETGSYTSVSTALLSTESTELGMAAYEERVHQKIIHEDEEVENNNVDAGLEKEFLAEPIKGQEKSIHLRKKILSGALIETMIRKPSLENLKDFHSESKDFEADLEIKADKNEISQDLEPEIKNIKERPDLESIPQAELKAEKKSEELDSESTTKQDSLDAESEGQDEIKIESDTKNLEIKNESEIVTENLSKDVIDQETGEFIESELPNNIEKKESDDGKNNDKKKDTDTPDDGHNEENEAPVIVSNEIIPSPKVLKFESQETPMKNEVTPTVSIEIKHVDDISEDSPPNFQGSNVDSAKDSSEGDSKEQESTNLTNVEIDSLTTVLVNHNRETRQESPMETSDDTILETSADAVTAIEENKSTIEDEINPKPREKRSIEDDKLVNSNLETTNQTIIKEDIIPIVKSEIKPINQEDIQISNDHELKDKIISSSAEKNNVQEPLEAVAEPSVQEITADSQIEDTITENKGDSEESKDVVKSNSQPEDEPDITSGADASDLSKNERKEVSADDLKLTETDVKLHPETNRLKENLESSTDEPNHAVEEVPTEDASEETQNIQKLSEQETIPIGSDSLETEETVPSEGNINKDKSGESNDDFHNFDVFTEGTDLKEKDNLSGSSRSKECTGEVATSDINDSMGESILIASTSLEDPSVEHELESPKKVVSEGYDSLKNIMDDISSSARELQQIIKTSMEGSIIDSNVPNERSESSQAEDQDQDQETLLINSDSKQVEINKLEDDPDVLSKIKSEESITPTEDQQSGKETLTINSETMKDESPKLEKDPVQLVKILTEGSKSSQAEDQQSDYETLTVNSESKPVEDSNIEGSETSQIETEQSDKEDIPTKSESVQAEDSKIIKDLTESNSIHSEDSEELNTKDIKPNSVDERTESTEKVLPTSPKNSSSSATGDSPKSEEEDLEYTTKGSGKEISEGDELLNSVDQRTESTALPGKNSSSTIKDGLKSGDDVEYPTTGHGKEMSMADTAIAVMELSPENKTEAINAQESEGTEAENNSVNDSAVSPGLAADKDKQEPDVEEDIKDEGPSAVLGKGDSLDHLTKTSETETLPLEKQESSTEMESKSAVVEDKDTAESKTKNDSPVPSNPEKNSSLLVSNQLIGTQNLPTNHIEIEKKHQEVI
ncbi:myosin-10-like [Drosophila subpulchrella]|uniref:myosin-10-like n=1 Tax=Drosophila subpulchrella TaxID=1486046 RepID=UPI0018A1AB89|nr:myosin-10-like [Drosophila subpulchrella]